MTPHQNRLPEKVLMRGHRIFFVEKQEKLSELQIRVGIKDNSKIFFLTSQ